MKAWLWQARLQLYVSVRTYLYQDRQHVLVYCRKDVRESSGNAIAARILTSSDTVFETLCSYTVAFVTAAWHTLFVWHACPRMALEPAAAMSYWMCVSNRTTSDSSWPLIRRQIPTYRTCHTGARPC